MRKQRYKDLEERVHQLENTVTYLYSLISQLDIIQYAVGETLLNRKVYSKEEVAQNISNELTRRKAASKPADVVEPEVVSAPPVEAVNANS